MSRLSPRLIVLALAIYAALFAASRIGRAMRPAFAPLPVETQGAFAPNGEYPGQPSDALQPIRRWGSWSGNDDNAGTLTLGPFTAPQRVTIAVSGYPLHDGIEVYLRRPHTTDQQRFTPGSDVGECWRLFDLNVPAAWVGQPIELCAVDHARGLGGWVGISEPLSGGVSGGTCALFSALAAGWLNAIVYGTLCWAALRLVAARAVVESQCLPLVAGAMVALLGYGAFWAYFVHPVLGKATSLGLFVAAAFLATRRAGATPLAPADVRVVLRLWVAVGALYVVLLYLIPSSLEPYAVAENRFLPRLPGDNTLPHNTARDLFAGEPLRNPAGEWQSSDRPPLQAGWLLLAWPIDRAFNIETDFGSLTAAIWFELLWLAAAYGVLRTLGIKPGRAGAWCVVIAVSGFALQNSVFTWPKLSAAAFGVAAFALSVPFAGNSTPRCVIAGVCAALGWLSHGGVAFALIAALPWVLVAAIRWPSRRWVGGAVAFAALAATWIAYQKFYDPPGDRLVKMHLAGQPARDPRSAWTVIREAYHAKPAAEILGTKLTNVSTLGRGDWRAMFDFSAARAADRRYDEFFWLARALTWWLFAPVALLGSLLFTRRRRTISEASPLFVTWLGWTAATVLVWCGLMFEPNSTVIHQGPYTILLVLFALGCAWFEAASDKLIYVVAAVQTASFVTTWLPANEEIRGPMTGLPCLIVVAAGLAVIFFRMASTEVPSAGAVKPVIPT